MSSKKNGSSKKITFEYQKTPNYRTFFVDGAHGGLNPKGYLHMQMYSERHHIPTRETMDLGSGKRVFDTKPDFIREVEASLIMDYPTMISVRDWLNSKIEEFEKKFVPETKKNLVKNKVNYV